MIYVGADMVDIVKTNKKWLCKDTKFTQDWIWGYYLVLNRKYVVPMDRLIIDIYQKYNYQKVISFNDKEDTGITKAGIPYLYKYSDPFSNIVISPSWIE